MNKIDFIKSVREYAPSVGLREAKELADHLDVRRSLDGLANGLNTGTVFEAMLRRIVREELEAKP